MRKRTLALLLAVSCTFLMTSCGTAGDERTSSYKADEARAELAEAFSEKESEEGLVEEKSEEEKDTPDKAVTPLGELSDDLYDFQISINGTVYQFPMWYSDFEALGWEYEGDPTETLSSGEHSSIEKWSKDGFEVYTRLANLSLNTVPFSESMVAGITINMYNLDGCDWEIMLPGGIQWGVSGIDDIIAAYGDPSDDYDGSSYYNMSYELDYYREIDLDVSKEEDVLVGIEIENMVELEGADNSIDETVPDLVKEYKAPSSLGDDLYVYTAQLEGVLYSLPCPVSVFLENGFTIDKANSDEVVGSGGTGWISLQYNNQVLNTMVENYADYATTIENCFVTTISITIYGPDLDLVFPGNIKIGDSEDAFKRVIDGFNCEVMTVESTTFYQIYDPNRNVMDFYSFLVEDGSVVSMQVQNSTKPEY